MPLIDFATAVKPELVYPSAAYPAAKYDPDASLNYAFDARGSYAAVIVVNAAQFTSSATLTLKLQESDDGSTWTDIPDGSFPGIAASPSGDQVASNAMYFSRVNFVHKKRYIGLEGIVATARATFGVTALLLSYDTRNNTTPSVVV